MASLRKRLKLLKVVITNPPRAKGCFMGKIEKEEQPVEKEGEEKENKEEKKTK